MAVSPFIFSIILAILSMLSYGVVDFIAFLLSRKADPKVLPFWVTLFSILAMSLGLVVFKFPFISNFNLFLLLVASLANVVATIAFFKGLSKGKIAVVVPIANTWSVVSILIGIFLLNETLNALQAVGIFLAVLGTILISFKFKDVLGLNFDKFKIGAEYAVVTMVGWGACNAILGALSKQIGWYWPSLTSQFIGALLLLLYLLLTKSKISFPRKVTGKIVAFGILVSLGILLLNASISYGYVALSAPIAASAPLITVALGMLFLKEETERSQLFGIMLVVIGIVLIAY